MADPIEIDEEPPRTLAIAGWFPDLPPVPAPLPWSESLRREPTVEVLAREARASGVVAGLAREIPVAPESGPRLVEPAPEPPLRRAPVHRSAPLRALRVGDTFGPWTVIRLEGAVFARCRCLCGMEAFWGARTLHRLGERGPDCLHRASCAGSGAGPRRTLDAP